MKNYDTLQDCSYPTVRYGRVPSFRGCRLTRGRRGVWTLEVGMTPMGSPDFVSRIGYVARYRSDEPHSSSRRCFWGITVRALWRDGVMPASALALEGEQARRAVQSALDKARPSQRLTPYDHYRRGIALEVGRMKGGL